MKNNETDKEWKKAKSTYKRICFFKTCIRNRQY